MLVGRNPKDGEVHCRVQVWDADLWGNHRVPKVHEISQLKSELSATLFKLSVMKFTLAIELN